MTWNQVCSDKSLADLPYKIETNRFGEIVMSPVPSPHTFFASDIYDLLRDLMFGGRPAHQLALQTADGVKEPDVVWTSTALVKKYRQVSPWPVAPEICVEVVSRSNTRQQMADKAALYFERGAVEVWTCDRKGRMTFFNRDGEIPQSVLCPKFPVSIAPES